MASSPATSSNSVFGGPYGVAVAADGTVWATLQAGNQLLRIARDGALETFNLPRPRAVPTDIAVAPDGAVWFVEFRGNTIGRFQDGQFVSFTVAEENAGPERDRGRRRRRGVVRHAARRQPRPAARR